MALADSLSKVAVNILDALGGDVTVRFVTAGAYDTSDGTIAETTEDTVVKGVVEDVSLAETNELIQSGDRRLIVAADDVATAPETKDRVVISSVSYQIIEVKTIEQDNTAITHELILRA
jgi:hypothetical protein